MCFDLGWWDVCYGDEETLSTLMSMILFAVGRGASCGVVVMRGWKSNLVYYSPPFRYRCGTCCPLRAPDTDWRSGLDLLGVSWVVLSYSSSLKIFQSEVMVEGSWLGLLKHLDCGPELFNAPFNVGGPCDLLLASCIE